MVKFNLNLRYLVTTLTCVLVCNSSSMAMANRCRDALREKVTSKFEWHEVELSSALGFYLKNRKVTIHLKDGRVITGKVEDSRQNFGIILEDEADRSRMDSIIQLDTISKIYVAVSAEVSTIASFQHKYRDSQAHQFDPPWGPKGGIGSIPDLVGKKAALFVNDSKNFKVDEVIEGTILEGLPHSPEYVVQLSDGRQRILQMGDILEIRVLSIPKN